MSMNPQLYLASSSDIVADYVERGVSSNSSFEVTRYRAPEELLAAPKPPGAAVIVLDYLFGNQKAEAFLPLLARAEKLRGIPIMLTYGPPFAAQAAALSKENARVKETLAKPYTVNQLLQMVLPFSMAIPSMTQNLSGLTASGYLAHIDEEERKVAASRPCYFAEINAITGVAGQFQWSTEGELIEASSDQAKALSEAIARTLHQVAFLSANCGVGDLQELHYYGAKESAALFSIAADPQNPADFRTVGIIVEAGAKMDEIIHAIRTGAMQ
jgi:hypothetical protein